jgi:hypothetical protein
VVYRDLKIGTNIQKTKELVQEINAASKEQKAGVEQIDLSIHQLDTVIQRNASVSEEMESTAEELMGQAEQLKMMVSIFTVEEVRLNRIREKSEIILFPVGNNTASWRKELSYAGQS